MDISETLLACTMVGMPKYKGIDHVTFLQRLSIPYMFDVLGIAFTSLLLTECALFRTLGQLSFLQNHLFLVYSKTILHLKQ